MKAIVYREYGSPDVLKLEEVEKPTPGDDQVLIRVHAASVNAADCHIIRDEPFYVRRMLGGILKFKFKVLGIDMAGRVEQVGRKVKQFKPGDQVYGDLSACGCGAFADYVCARQDDVALKPVNLSFEQAAAVPMAGVTALQGLRDVGHIQSGQKVLITGATGGVGSFAVQIAKTFGAHVTAVASTGKMDMAHALGADRVIDYTKGDFVRMGSASGEQYDLILDVATYRSPSDYGQILAPQGIYVLAGGSIARIFQLLFLGGMISKKNGRQFLNLMAKPSSKDLDFLSELLETSKIVPVIDKCFPLDQVARALCYLEARHVKGKVVITNTQTQPQSKKRDDI